MKKRIFCAVVVILSFILCCCIFAGCNKYHAVFYSNAQIWMSKDFIIEHKLYNIYYDDGTPKDGDLVYKDGTYVDRTSPKNYTFIINDEEQFISIFTHYKEEISRLTIEEIDFDKSTVILYIFCCSDTKNYNLKNIEITEKTAEIYYKEDLNYLGHTTEPYFKCLMVVLDKVDIQTARFICK